MLIIKIKRILCTVFAFFFDQLFLEYTMTQAQSLAQRCREVFLDGLWIADTNYYEQLSRISWTQACHSVNGRNSIAALTLHMHYYIAGLLRFFQSGVLDISDKFSFSGTLPQSEDSWMALRQEFFRDAEYFVNSVSLFSDEQLQSMFFKEEYGTFQRNIEAMIEHAYYHLGQITLLAKMTDSID